MRYRRDSESGLILPRERRIEAPEPRLCSMLPVFQQGQFGRSMPAFSIPAFFKGANGGWWDFGVTSSVWSDTAETVQAVTDDPIASVQDLSGNGRSLSNSTAGQRPELRTTSGVRSAQFVRANSDCLFRNPNNSFGSAAGMVAMYVFSTDNSTQEQMVLTSERNTNRQFNTIVNQSYVDGNYYVPAAARALSDVSAYTLNTKTQITHWLDGTNWVIRKNGTQIKSGTIGSTMTNSAACDFAMGGSSANTVTSNSSASRYSGHIYSAMCMDRSPTLSELQAAEAYMMAAAGM